jgi:hypothetical protein
MAATSACVVCLTFVACKCWTNHDAVQHVQETLGILLLSFVWQKTVPLVVMPRCKRVFHLIQWSDAQRLQPTVTATYGVAVSFPLTCTCTDETCCRLCCCQLVGGSSTDGMPHAAAV